MSKPKKKKSKKDKSKKVKDLTPPSSAYFEEQKSLSRAEQSVRMPTPKSEYSELILPKEIYFDVSHADPSIDFFYQSSNKSQPSLSEGVKFSQDLSFASGAGYAHLDRKPVPGEKSFFGFRIIRAVKRDLEFGIELFNEKSSRYFRQIWVWSLADGTTMKGIGSQREIYTNKAPVAGDIIVLEIEDGNIRFYLNDEDLGLAFSDPMLDQPGIVPFVFLAHGDEVELVGVQPSFSN